MTTTDALRALRAESVALATALRALTADDLTTATRCTPWTVHTLGGHVVRGIERTVGMLNAPSDRAPDDNRLVYYQSPLRSDPSRAAKRNEGAERVASRLHSGPEIGAAIERAVAEIDALVTRAGAAVNVKTHWGPVMRLEDYLITRVVELAVHGIDLADSLDQPAWLTTPAASVIISLIEDLAGGTIEATAIAPAVLIRAATGRQRLSPTQAASLGATAACFPVFT